ncbi:hypothetical protein [Variovorax terrae]|uniref:PhoD-like phosphatase metallophosphatase domain-containing protein n=1 Tax=Variovorax terrae TaxID=2923278 RepID=A0A9X1VW40_9BURK|nr:hypothetical protein [Variovorax terrae]MCJ0764881.1 hypothetical protein [Variovorax terrae]
MRIAFTSCASARLVARQPVWDHIRAAAPDVLLLMGDNIYNDVPDTGIAALEAMSELEFAEHLMQRYCEQLSVPSFARLVAQPDIGIHAIWDDHDFLWNDPNGGNRIHSPRHADKIRISTSLMRLFRRALTLHDVNAFPTSSSHPDVWQDWLDPGFAGLGATSMPLEISSRAWLHLTDGRSFRDTSTLLGAAQRQALAARFAQAPGALHVIVSGSTYGSPDGWKGAPADADWLFQQMGGRHWLMLSGDVHANAFNLHRRLGPDGPCLVEATASGAALRAYLNKIVPGKELCNYGLLNLEDAQAEIGLFSFAQEQDESPHRFARLPEGSLAL